MSADTDSFIFEGGDSTECDRFIRYVRMKALMSRAAHDDFWTAKFAAACLGGEALRWHLTLDLQTQDDWKELQKALVEKFSSTTSSAGIVPSPAAAPSLPLYVARIKLLTDSPDTSGYISRYHNSNGSLRPCKMAKDAMWVKLALFSPLSRFHCLNAQAPLGKNDWLGVHFHDVSGLDKGKGNIAHANFTPMSYVLDGSSQHLTCFEGPAQTAIWSVTPNKEVNISWDVNGRLWFFWDSFDMGTAGVAVKYDLSTIAISWSGAGVICIPVDYDEFTKHNGVTNYYTRALLTQQTGLYFRPDVVEKILAPRPDASPPPTVLDIGTGSGIWAIDMSKKFPHVRVVGVDLAPPNPSQEVPSNCRFKCRDVNGLKDLKEALFDVIHVRCVCVGITDYREFLKDEVLAILRPGGIFLSIEGDLQTFNEFKEPNTGKDENDPAKGNVGITLYPHIAEFLKGMGDVWVETGKEVIWQPIGPWPSDLSEKERNIAELTRRNLLSNVKAHQPMRLSAGHDPEEVERLV
ncbi:hypothetical protein FRB99_005612 [Tulasnella sp. 403]|nr:hypothetical protein FRB99_005612 [Tulasnella sp. 403]